MEPYTWLKAKYRVPKRRQGYRSTHNMNAKRTRRKFGGLPPQRQRVLVLLSTGKRVMRDV